MQQLELFAPTTPAPIRTWADVRPGERSTYNVPGSPWHGHWTIRRIEPHPSAHDLLIVTLADDTGRTWVTWRHRDVPFDAPEVTR